MVKAHFFEQRQEARLIADAVINRIDFEIQTLHILLIVTFLQPIQGFVLFTETQVLISDRSESWWPLVVL